MKSISLFYQTPKKLKRYDIVMLKKLVT